MKSLICYNIFSQGITYLEIIEREKTIYELKCLCRENLLPIIEKEINPFGG